MVRIVVSTQDEEGNQRVLVRLHACWAAVVVVVYTLLSSLVLGPMPLSLTSKGSLKMLDV